MNPATEPIEVLELAGSPREMGRQHGEAVRERARGLADERMRLLMAHAAEVGQSFTREQVLDLAGRSLPIHQSYAPAVHEEFLGIAEGADLSPAELLVGNGYTDLRDRLAHGAGMPEGMGCTAFAVRPERTATGGVLAGQSWDMHASAEAFVLAVRRRPADGPESFSVTTTGCLSLMGLNAEGIAVGNNNLAPTDPRDGVMYLAIIHNVLAQATLERAVAAVVDCPRMSGHNYYIADAKGNVRNVETTGGRHRVFEVDGPFFAHSNHYLDADLAALASEAPAASTVSRLARIEALLNAHEGPFAPETAEGFLADREGGEERCMCRLGTADDEVRTCAVAILSPGTGEVFCHKGPARTAPLQRFVVGG